jgi:hypothetical protein
MTIVDDNSYNVEIEFNKVPENEHQIIGPLKSILEILFSNRYYLIQESERINIINMYNDMFSDYIYQKNIHISRGKMLRYENKPRNIKIKDIQTMTNYSVTNKLNGVGIFLMITSIGIFILNQTNVDKLSRHVLKGYENSIFHGEMWNNEFFIFDTVKYCGKDVTLKSHSERLSYAEKTIDVLSSVLKDIITIQTKVFIYTGNLENDTKTIMQYMYNKFGSDALENNDGIMYTPVNLPYINDVTLKFKFPSTMSIDFFVENEKKDEKGTTYDIKVYDKNNNLVLFDHTFKHRLNPVMFVSKTSPFYNLISNGVIVETVYDKVNKYFTPIKIREDKDRPNFLGVASDVFNDIMEPLSLDKLVQLFHDNSNSNNLKSDKPSLDCLMEMRKFHNLKKKELISKYTKNKTVLDLGFGRGGDIHKYAENDVEFIWGVEPNEDNYKEAYRRLSTKKELRNKVKIIKLKAQQSADIFDQMKDEDGKDQKVDIVVSFFSLTFFFENENELDRLVNTIASALKKGGMFIGTTMDGEKTYEFLKNKKEKNEEGCYKIIKYYEDDDKMELGKKLMINLDETIVSDQYEYLAFFDILVNKLEKRGVYLVSTHQFEPPQSLDSRVIGLSKLFRSFVFERQETQAEKKSKERMLQEKKIIKEEKKNRLEPADLDKTLTFNNYFDENSQLVRTGTVGEGSCFFHSVLRAIDPNYVKLDEEKRRIIVERLRKNMADKLSEETWKNFANGSLVYGLVVPRFTAWIRQKELTEVENKIDRVKANNLEEFLNELLKLIPTELHKRITKAFNAFINKIFEEFKSNLTDCSVWVGQEKGSVDIIEYISDLFNIDIYLIRDSTRKPYRSGTDCTTRFKQRKSIIVLWVGNSHYETVGKLENKKITRVFDPSDSLIEKIYSIVC